MGIIKNGFKNERLGIELDVHLIEGKEWFKAKDISDILKYETASQMTRILDEPDIDKVVYTMHSLGGFQNTSFISESALYELVLKIRKTDEERYIFSRCFKRWVFDEVLPSLRKNNFYVDKDNVDEKQLAKLKDYLFDLCDVGKISLGRASKKLFGNESELKKRFINLGWIDYESCKFAQKKFKASNGKLYDLFVCNMSGSYDDGIAKHTLQVSLTNAGYIWLKNCFENNLDFGAELLKNEVL